MNWIEIIGGVVGGSGIATLIQYFRDTKKDRSEEVFKVLDEYKVMIKELRATENECKVVLKEHAALIKNLHDTISDLRSQVILLESASNDLPFPMWLKDVDSKMLYVNNEYEIAFLKPNGFTSADYMGKYDVDIWGIEIGKIYKETDKKTLRLKGTHYLAEDPIIIQGEDITQKWKVIKYLRYVGKVVVGIGGIAIPYEGK